MMKMILKVLALPVLLVVKIICILGNLLTNISSYVIGLLLLVIVGCAIYCIVQAMWTSLAILAVSYTHLDVYKRQIYDAVGQMGFETGNILEPAMGIGNFFGMLPPEMQSSRLYGVELDSITGRIAQKLYPNAEIKVAGFETTDRRDFYDLAVGNVPFGNYKVSDKLYDKLGFSIHNYFFAKALDQVRPGGVVAFVTSRFTMDSKNSDARRYMAQRAELLGAIRLPNDAFKKNAGTEVVSDILFLQKRDHPIDIVPEWVNLDRTEEGHTMNSYFCLLYTSRCV